MKYSKSQLAAVFSLSMFMLSPGYAADDKAEDPSKWTGKAALGYILNQGNTDSSNLNALFEIEKSVDRSRTRFSVEAYNEEEDNTATAERYQASAKYEYKLRKKDYVFAYTDYDADRFTEFDSITTVSFGYGRLLLKNDSKEWSVEAGPGYRHSDYDAGYDEEELIGRFASEHIWKLNSTAVWTNRLKVESGSDVTITRFSSALESQLVGALATNIKFVIENKDEVPPGDKKTDKHLSVSLLYKF